VSQKLRKCHPSLGQLCHVHWQLSHVRLISLIYAHVSRRAGKNRTLTNVACLRPVFLQPTPTRRHICPPSHVLCDFNWRLLWGTRRLTVSDQSRFGPKRSKPGPWVRLKGARSGWDRELELELKSTAAHSGKIYLLKVVLIEGFKVGLKNKDYIMLSAKNWI